MVVRESLEDVTALNGLSVTRVETWQVGSAAVHGQSPVWTATYFEGPSDLADEAAELLASAIAPGPWYANMETPSHEVVIFRRRVIKYVRGDVDAYRAAQEYARAIRVPEHQLKWSEELESCDRPDSNTVPT